MKKAREKEEAHRKVRRYKLQSRPIELCEQANFQTWVKIADKLCDESDYEMDQLNQMDECFAINPMHFLDEPFRVCRPIVFNPAGGFAVDLMGGLKGQFNGYRKNIRYAAPNNCEQLGKTICSNDACKQSWLTCIKTMTEKFGTQFKPGLEAEAAIMKLYDKKMNCYIDLLDI